jgi:hypothetical protein
MFNPGRLGCLLGLVAAVATSPGAAQSAAELRDRITRLQQVLDRRVAVDLRADSVTRSRILVDTVRAGALRVLTHRALTPLVTAAADSAWRTLEHTFGPTAARAGKGLMIIQSQAHPAIPSPPARILSREITVPRTANLGDVARYLVSYGASFIGTERDTALANWMHSEFAPTLSRDDRLELVYLEMVTSPWSKARGCYLGDLQDCRAALGLSGRADPIRGWYDAADRRTKVRDLPPSRWVTNALPAQQCRNGGSDETCEVALRTMPVAWVETPLSGTARFSLVFLALETGGVGAYDRIAASTDRSIESRLAAGAFLSGDSLLALWRGRVLAARPRTVALGPSGGGAWSAVLWSVFLGVLALRSTRWR